MMNMDNFWKEAQQSFHFDNKKTVWIGYTISIICISIAVLKLGLIIWRHQEFSAKAIECIALSSTIGIIGFVFCYFRKSAPIRVKYYTACLVMTTLCAYIFILHPDATTRRYPNPLLNHTIFCAGIIFFGGAGLCVLYNDYKWHLKKKKERNKQNN